MHQPRIEVYSISARDGDIVPGTFWTRLRCSALDLIRIWLGLALISCSWFCIGFCFFSELALESGGIASEAELG